MRPRMLMGALGRCSGAVWGAEAGTGAGCWVLTVCMIHPTMKMKKPRYTAVWVRRMKVLQARPRLLMASWNRKNRKKRTP